MFRSIFDYVINFLLLTLTEILFLKSIECIVNIILAASPLASRGFVPRGLITSSITYPVEKNANVSQIFANKLRICKKNIKVIKKISIYYI